MKKKLLFVLAISAAFVVNAQWCQGVNAILPNPSAQIGFPDPNTIPCAVQGVSHSDTIYFQMYSNFNFQGQQSIDSVTLDTFFNLPCGLCWTLNKASRTYAANEFGVLYVTGTTNDAVGQYNLRLQVTAYINHDPTGVFIQNPNEVDAAGIKMWLRVSASAGSCAMVDTSVNGVDQVAATSCPSAGIEEVPETFTRVNLAPNPMSLSTVLSFTSGKNATLTVKVTDITGKLISVKEMEANPGLNTAVIEKGKLSAGIYLLTLSDGTTSITRKITVVE